MFLHIELVLYLIIFNFMVKYLFDANIDVTFLIDLKKNMSIISLKVSFPNMAVGLITNRYVYRKSSMSKLKWNDQGETDWSVY